MIEYTARITSTDTPRVGGRNLLRDSGREAISKDKYMIAEYALADLGEIVEGETYHVKVWATVEGEDNVIQLYNNHHPGFGTVTIENGVAEATFKWDNYYYKGVPRVGPFNIFRREYFDGNTDTTITIHKVKLERGTVATDWTPAPEDVAESVSTVNNSLTALASTLLDPEQGEIYKLTAQQDQIISRQDQSDANALQQYAYFGKEISKSLRLSEDLSHALGGKASQEDLNKYVTNIVEATNKIQAQLCEMSVFGVSSSGYVDVKKRDRCPMPGTNIINGGVFSSPEYQSSQIRLTLRSDHDALKRQVDTLTAQLAQLQATTKITPVLNTGLRKRGSTLYPRYGDWLLTSDSEEQYISFSGLSAEVGRSIYIQTRKRAYLYSNGHSFHGLPGTSTQGNRWLSNNTTYRFVRADATTWLVTASSSPYPWT